MSLYTHGMARAEKRAYIRDCRAHLSAENMKWPGALKEVPLSEWPGGFPDTIISVMRSRLYLVQVYQEADGVIRMSIHRTAITDDGEWEEGITWDNLQAIKREAGYADRYAVEVYPADSDIVNVANIRHLWLLPEPPAFAWRKK